MMSCPCCHHIREMTNNKKNVAWIYKRRLYAKVYMINLPLYYYRYNEKSTYNKNRKETFKNSLKISEKYYNEIIKNKVPDFYKFLTWFYAKDDKPVIKDVKEINEFLEQTAKEFRDFYNWTDEQYKEVKIDILKMIEKYAVFKYLVSRYGGIGADFETKETQQLAIIRLARRGKMYLRKNGAKKTICKIVQKVKGKIWKKK